MSGPDRPGLPDDLEALLRRLRLPHMRRIAGDVIATARAQRWEPAEVLRALLTEELGGRERSALATRRAIAAFPTGKTFGNPVTPDDQDKKLRLVVETAAEVWGH